jgi:hypothetical protein
MSRGERVAFAAVVTIGVLVFGTASAAAYAWHRSGSVRLAVHESGPDGVDMAFTLPGALVNAAIALCPMPRDLTVDPDLAELLPVVRGATESLVSMPDAVLVDIDRDGEHVRIAKSGGEILVSVRAKDGHFELAVPVESLRRIVAKLEAKAASTV